MSAAEKLSTCPVTFFNQGTNINIHDSELLFNEQSLEDLFTVEDLLRNQNSNIKFNTKILYLIKS